MVPDPAILRATAVPSASAAAAAITGRGRRTGRTAVVQRLNPLNIDDIIKNPGSKTTFEVGMLADNSWKKFNSSKGNGRRNISGDMNKSRVNVTSMADQKPKQLDHNSDSDSEEDMVEGLLTISDTKENYKIPSQADLIRQAFAGDDVEAEFEKDKMEILNEENPEPEKPALIPGWGQWTDIQQKKGLPSWMVKEHENAKRKREEALKRRKDVKLKHVIISEHVDKKAEKFYQVICLFFTLRRMYVSRVSICLLDLISTQQYQFLLLIGLREGEVFEVSEAVAMESQTIRHMIEDNCIATGIPLPNVSAKVLSKVIEYCRKHAEARRRLSMADGATNATEPTDRATKAVEAELKTFDSEFVQVDQSTLFDIILAANFLHIEGLLDLTCQTVADMIKGKTPEEIRKTLNIENDFTPEEEEEVRRENQWAFD